MNYNELKKNVDVHRREISAQKHQLKKIESELKELRESRIKLEENYQKDVDSKKVTAHDLYIKSMLEPYEQRVSQLERELEDLSSKYTEEMKSLTEEKVEGKYTDEKAMTAEIKASLNVLQDKLCMVISPRFQKELCSQLEQQSINIDNQDLEELINYFNRQSLKIERMSQKTIKFDFMGYLNNQFLKDNPMEALKSKREADAASPDSQQDQSKEKIGFAVFTMLLIAVVILATVYVFPFYLIGIVVFSIYNLCRSYKIFSALIAQKVVQDNVKQIDDSLRERVLADLEKQKSDLEESYNRNLQNKQNELNTAKESMNSTLMQAEKSFVFDASTIKESLDAAMRVSDNREMTLVASQKDINVKLDNLYKLLRESEAALSGVASEIQMQYLDFNKVGTDTIFDPKFLLDVKDANPVFFNHPQESCVFVYNDYHDVSNLIRLMSVQLRIRMNPFNLSISVADLGFMGANYLLLRPTTSKKDDSIKNLYRVLGNKEQLSERLDEYTDDLQRRNLAIRNSYDNIKEYNKFMKSIDSLTESYDFFFFIEPEIGALNDVSFQQILFNGSSVGIFTHLFIQEDRFYSMGKDARNLVDKVGSIYLLKDGEIFKRAKDFALENLIKPE